MLNSSTPQLRLSTASRLSFDAGQFDVFSSTVDDLALLRGEPLPGALGLQAAPQLNSDAGVLPEFTSMASTSASMKTC